MRLSLATFKIAGARLWEEKVEEITFELVQICSTNLKTDFRS